MDSAELKLVQKAINGDAKALDTLVSTYFKDILYLAISQSSIQDAEDIASKSVIKIYEKIGTLKNPEAFVKWMIRIVHNTTINHLKEVNRNLSYVPLDPETEADIVSEDKEFLPGEHINTKELQQTVFEEMKKLSQLEFSCLQYYYFGNLKRAEISEIEGLPPRSISNALNHGKVKLRKLLQKRLGDAVAFSVVPFAGTPILAEIFKMNQAETITTELSSEILQSTQKLVSSSNVTLAKGGVTLGKIISGVIIVATAIGGVFYTMGNQESLPTEEPLSKIVMTEEIELPQITETPEPASEMQINTLEDMIGEENAAKLNYWIESTVENEAAELFMQEIGAEQCDQASEYEYQYKMYKLIKQDKRLFIAVKQSESSGVCKVLYTFGQIEEPELEPWHVILLFDEV